MRRSNLVQNSVIEVGAKQRRQSLGILNSSGVLGAAAPKGLGRSPYKICELDVSSLKASKNLEFLRINLQFLEIASVALLPRND